MDIRQDLEHDERTDEGHPDACAALPSGLRLGYRAMLVLYDVLWMDNIAGGA
jgi:hypothetical protein